MDQFCKKFAILITTKNRKKDLVFTLEKIKHLLEREDLICKIFDDGSSDETFEYVLGNYPQIFIVRNRVSKGYLYCRNKMLNETKSEYAISLDDDAHFLSQEPLEKIEHYFNQNPNCGVLAMRIFWGLDVPLSDQTSEKPVKVKSFVGCAHVWRMSAWQQIPNYPEWFVFYGEEDFASFQLFKKKWEVHYLPEILVNHRVNMKERKNNSDFRTRQRRSLSSGWYLFFLFYPMKVIPRKMVYSIWMQMKLKVLKGDLKVLLTIVLSLTDLFFHFFKLLRNANRLNRSEFDVYQKTENAKIYWKIEK